MNDQTPIQSLVEIPKESAFAVFATARVEGQPHPIDPILARVRSEVDAFAAEVLDVAKPADRKRIASMAYRLAQSKTAIEKVGKALAADAKDVPKRIDATRRHVDQTLSAWQAEVRQPLTDWEIAEDARLSRHGAAIARIVALGDAVGLTAAQARDAIAEIEAVDTSEEVGEEFAGEYRIAIDGALPKLRANLARAEQQEKDQAELKRLREAAAAREAEERAERLRKEGEERARLDAEADARAERERVANEAARKEAEHKAQVEALERKAVEAAAAERQKIEDARKQEADAAAAREKSRAHKAKVHRAAVAAFMANGADEETAVLVVTLIAKGMIPGITVNY